MLQGIPCRGAGAATVSRAVGRLAWIGPANGPCILWFTCQQGLILVSKFGIYQPEHRSLGFARGRETSHMLGSSRQSVGGRKSLMLRPALLTYVRDAVDLNKKFWQATAGNVILREIEVPTRLPMQDLRTRLFS